MRHEKDTETPLQLVQRAVREPHVFKQVSERLADMEPDGDAARWLVDAFESTTAPPWLAAHLLGQIGHAAGYDAVLSILESGVRSLSEDYAGPALARIDAARARRDLARVMFAGRTRRIREGAASGLALIGGDDLPALLIRALREQAIFEPTGAALLEPLLTDDEVRALAGDAARRVAGAARQILEQRASANDRR